MLRAVRLGLLAALLASLGGCAVIAVTGAVIGAGVTVASTAIDVGVAVGKGAVKVGSAVLSDDEDEKPTPPEGAKP
jgi:hypothetical protein